MNTIDNSEPTDKDPIKDPTDIREDFQTLIQALIDQAVGVYEQQRAKPKRAARLITLLEQSKGDTKDDYIHSTAIYRFLGRYGLTDLFCLSDGVTPIRGLSDYTCVELLPSRSEPIRLVHVSQLKNKYSPERSALITLKRSKKESIWYPTPPEVFNPSNP